MAIVLRTPQKEIEIENHSDKTLLELARENQIYIKSGCEGRGECMECIVNLLKGTFQVKDKIVDIQNIHRALSCQTKILSSDALISIPWYSLVEDTGKVLSSFNIPPYERNPQTLKVYLQIPDATLDDQSSDYKRVIDSIDRKTSVKVDHIPLSLVQKLARVLHLADGQLTATLAKIRDRWNLIDIELNNTTAVNYVVALDIGTTTVAGLLIDLYDGSFIANASTYNQQISIAEDVISRISYCDSDKEVKYLQKLIIQDSINPVLKQMCSEVDISSDSIHRMAVSGNTIMMHLLLGLNPENLGKVPFPPVIRAPFSVSARELDIGLNDHAVIDFIPSISGYVGGDIVADAYVSKLKERSHCSVLIDIGTNAEIVMNDHGKMTACSTAAGPAFEGFGLYHGCRASTGVIEKIYFSHDGRIHVETIDNQKAVGICGTGIIDFIAESLRIGLINYRGRFNSDLLKKMGLYTTLTESGTVISACMIAKSSETSIDSPILITQNDIIKIMQAKAAVYAGLQTLLKIQNKQWNDIDQLILAGGFAKYINIQNAIRIGLLPDIPNERIEIIGNGALAGAFMALIEDKALHEMDELSRQVRVIELNQQEDFETNYINAMFFKSEKKNTSE